jgi:hypothetical protein
MPDEFPKLSAKTLICGAPCAPPGVTYPLEALQLAAIRCNRVEDPRAMSAIAFALLLFIEDVTLTTGA